MCLPSKECSSPSRPKDATPPARRTTPERCISALLETDRISGTKNHGVHCDLLATPEELVCQRETLDEIMTVLALCTKTQRERFLLYALGFPALSFHTLPRQNPKSVRFTFLA